MSGDVLPLDLKKVLRERMLSLLHGKSVSEETKTSSSDNVSENSSGKSNELIQTAFSTFLDEKRKQITTTENPESSVKTASHSECVNTPSCDGVITEPPKNSRPVAVALPQPRSEMAEKDAPTTAPMGQPQPPSLSEVLVESSSKEKLNSESKKKEKVKTKSVKNDKSRHENDKKNSKVASNHHSRKESPSSSRKLEKKAPLSSSDKHSSRSEKSKHGSHSKDSHRDDKRHHIKDSKEKKHKENKKHEENKKHATKRSRSHSTSKDHSRHRNSSESKSDRKRRTLRDSSHSGTIFDEMNVDPHELEKFVKDLMHKSAPPAGSSASSSYTCTFKRHPSPPFRNQFHPSKRHHFEIESRYSAAAETSTKTSIKTSHEPPSKATELTSNSQNGLGTVHNSGKKTLKELTDFCRKIAEQNKKKHNSEGDNNSERDDSDGDDNGDGAPGRVTGARNAIKMNIKDAKELKAKSAVEQLKAMYPVSTGLDHMFRERDTSKWSPEQVNPTFHLLIKRRLEAVKVLTQNPNDYAALLTIEECDAKISSWAATPNGVLDAKLSVPATAQPSTSTAPQPLPVQGPQLPPAYANIPPEAIPTAHLHWAHPDYLHMIARSKLDIGKKLLEKLGWREGFGLGKDLAGNKDPILPDVKLDRKGLFADTELQRPMVAKVLDANGKHPVSMLQEASSQRRWGVPNFEVTEAIGPPHRQAFLMRVTVNGVIYQPTSACPTKKEAKALAATLALQSLGLWRGEVPSSQNKK